MTPRPMLDTVHDLTAGDARRAAAAGYGSVGRYLPLGRWKSVTAPEVANIHGAGLGLVLVYETTANRAGAGRLAGASDAVHARIDSLTLTGNKWPHDRPLYLAVDYDASLAEVAPYFDGAAAEAQARGFTIGAYGPARVVARLASVGIVSHAWAAAGWKHGAGTEHLAMIQQYPPASALGFQYDHNVPLADDLGAWHPNMTAPKPPTKGDTMTPEQERMLREVWAELCTSRDEHSPDGETAAHRLAQIDQRTADLASGRRPAK